MNLRESMSMPLAALTALAPSAALAHDGAHNVPTFESGLIHPFGGADHIALLGLSALVIGFVINRGWRPDKGSWISAAGLFSLSASIIAQQPYAAAVSAALLCFGLWLSWNARSIADGTHVTIISVTAIALQLLSHFLARGDVQPSTGFALGYAIGSMVIFGIALSLTLVTNRIMRFWVRSA